MTQDKIGRLNFFTHLYKEVSGGNIEIRLIDGEGKVERHFHSLRSFKNDLPSMAFPIDANAYFAVATRNGGGTKEHIHQIPAFWCDIDFKNIDQTKVDKLLAGTPFQPSAIIESGGGYHLYWFLKEPLQKTDIPLAESINSRLAQYYDADPAPAEAARVLRIPGSVNIKYNPSRPVGLKSLTPTLRYNPDDFDEWLPANPASAYARALKKKEYTRTGDFRTCDFTRLQVTSTDFNMFAEGSRDESLFHIANCLVKGGMETETLSNVLNFLAIHCNPPFPEKEVRAKIESALNRNDRRNRNLAEEVRDFVVTSSGFFMTSDVFSRLQVTSRQDKKAVVLELLRLKEKEIIKPHGEKNGCYRKIECDCEPEDWQNACTDAADLWLPFDLDEMVLIPAGGLISVAGEPNSGKTAILLNIAKENRKKFKVHYFSSELGAGAFKRRIEKFSDITPDQWKISFYPRADNFADVIKRGEGNLNIIDFLEIYENFYLVSKHLAEIHKKLDGAVAVIALQKAKGRDDGHGGTFTREKPVLSLSVSPGKVKITKLKEWREGIENPNSKEYEFKLVDGCQFIKVLDWHIPMT